MLHLMFHCANSGCNHQNDTRLVCSACQRPLPVLDEMSAFLTMWKYAIHDYRRNMKRGLSLSSWASLSQSYALDQQTARGVGPGARKPVKEEAAMGVGVSSEPPPKRQKGSRMSAGKQLAYINK
eukprot:14733691-Alexandrium_andersonii.AAC.1